MAEGKIVAYVGTMGAGKTKKLCSLYKKLSEEGKQVIVFKHLNDVERGGHEDMVVARNGDSAPAVAIDSLAEILLYETERLFDAILIDEIQFFDDEFTIEVLEGAAFVGVDVYVFGLDVTSEMKTFGLMGEVLSRADEVKKLKSKCHKCGSPARISEYIGDDEKDCAVKVGDLDEYAPTCRQCFYSEPKREKKKEEPKKVEEQVEDKFYEFKLHGADFGLELGVYDSELAKAGYTVNDIKDINSSEGITNLLKDLGYYM